MLPFSSKRGGEGRDGENRRSKGGGRGAGTGKIRGGKERKGFVGGLWGYPMSNGFTNERKDGSKRGK